jgi:hypothetical protein
MPLPEAVVRTFFSRAATCADLGARSRNGPPPIGIGEGNADFAGCSGALRGAILPPSKKRRPALLHDRLGIAYDPLGRVQRPA